MLEDSVKGPDTSIFVAVFIVEVLALLDLEMADSNTLALRKGGWLGGGISQSL